MDWGERLMTTLVSSSPIGETALQKELNLFSELFVRLGNAFLNRIFDLRPAKAARRMRYFLVLFFISGFLISLQFYTLDLWAKYIQDIFLYSLNPAYAASYVGNPFTNFFAFIRQVFIDPRIFQYLPIFLAPFFIALQCAALYLVDVFELEHVSVARKFILAVALLGSEETIRVSQGDISEEHHQSSTFLIGGPGKVVVDLDSVALFEKPDGTPHIIGPTGKEPGGKATLDGFERFRQAIDLRDHFIDLRDQDPKSFSIQSRSLDGIPVEATDVRLMFSIYRDGKQPDTEHPYLFSEKAVEQLIYKASSQVTAGQANPSTFKFSWINNMISLIRAKLGGFMSERNLTVYLAGIGMPEFEKAKQHEEVISEQESLLGIPVVDESRAKEIKPPPKFTARYEITNLFTQFEKEFTESSHSRGVELHWIGVGTWKTPAEIVPQKHLEAWKISRENLIKGSEMARSVLETETISLNITSLIQDVPIAAYQKIRSDEANHTKAVKQLIIQYRQQLREAETILKENGEAVARIQQAIKYIDELLFHWVSGKPPESE
jgi:hypothetical protein